MARIRPYESQVSSQGDLPAQRAGEGNFGGPGLIHVGQAVEDLGASAGQVQRFMLEQKQRQEVTDAAVAHAELQTLLADELDAKAKAWTPIDKETGRPNPPLSETFTGILKNRIDSLNGGDEGSRFETAGGADAARRHGAQTTQHFMALTREMDAKLAGDAAATQYKTFVGSRANFLQNHPAYFAVEQDRLTKFVNDPHGQNGRLPEGVKARMIAEGMEELAVSAVQGYIRKSPKSALDTLNDPGLAQDERYGWMVEHIPNEKMQALIGDAQERVHAQGVEERQALAEERLQRKELSDRIETSLMEKDGLHRADAKQEPLKAMDVVEAMENGLDGTTGRAILNMLDEHARRGPVGVHTNETVERNLFKRIYLPDGDPKKIIDTAPIYDAYLKQQLSDTDMGRLRDELVKSRSPEGSQFGKEKANFLKGIEPQITKPGAFGIYADPTTPEKFAEFQRELEATIANYHKAGKDPRTLFDPNSKDYFGTVAKSSKYQSTGFGSTDQTIEPYVSPTESLVVPNPDRSQWNARTDGTEKGDGFFGVLKRPDGKVSSELSTSDPIDKSGKEVLHPLIVPTLTRQELDYLLNDRKDNKAMENNIYDKAAAHARKRIAAGKSPFAGPGEQTAPPGRPSLDDIFGGKK